ncbi:MAG: hypothetical protein ACTS3R_21395 [Inquilinaceae bacterium]
MTKRTEFPPSNADALDRLVEREEVLQICYWYRGEGFGDRFTPAAVMPFLQSDPKIVAEMFASLAMSGDLVLENGSYAFTEAGRRRAGRMFFDTFTEFQQAGHGECTAGCCDGDEVCDDPTHSHAPAAGFGAGMAAGPEDR